MKANKLHGNKGDFVGDLTSWQSAETKVIDCAAKAIPKVKTTLARTVLQALKLEAEKRRLIQQMILDSETKESIHLSPDELKELSVQLNAHLDAEEEAAKFGKEAFDKIELPVPRYLLSYLLEDLKRHNSLLRRFDGRLKEASIATSATSKTFRSSRAA